MKILSGYYEKGGEKWGCKLQSSKSEKEYIVSYNHHGLRCSCPDCTYRMLQGRIGIPLQDKESYCKHMKAVLKKINNYERIEHGSN